MTPRDDEVSIVHEDTFGENANESQAVYERNQQSEEDGDEMTFNIEVAGNNDRILDSVR